MSDRDDNDEWSPENGDRSIVGMVETKQTRMSDGVFRDAIVLALLAGHSMRNEVPGGGELLYGIADTIVLARKKHNDALKASKKRR